MVEEAHPTYRRMVPALTIGVVVGGWMVAMLLLSLTYVLLPSYPPDCRSLLDEGWALVRCRATQGLHLLWLFPLPATIAWVIGVVEVANGTIQVKDTGKWLRFSVGGGLVGGLFGWMAAVVLIAIDGYLARLVGGYGYAAIVALTFFFSGVGGIYGLGIGIAQASLFDTQDGNLLSKWVTTTGYSAAIVGGVVALLFLGYAAIPYHVLSPY